MKNENEIQKPLTFSMAGGSNEPGTTQIYNPDSIKEMLKTAFGWNDKVLNENKDVRTDIKFFNNLNVRETLMKLGTEIGRETHGDIHVLNHIENIINQVDRGEDIKPIVCAIGYAGHGKDYQISQLEGDFAATGDIRFPNELKFVLIVNKYRNEPKRLKEELMGLASKFTYDPELLDIKLYSYLMGTGTEWIQNAIIEEIEDAGVNSYEGFLEIYENYREAHEVMPTLHEMLRKMGYTKSDDVFAVYQDIISRASDYVVGMVQEDELVDFDLAEFDAELEYFYYDFDENGEVKVQARDVYTKEGREDKKWEKNWFLDDIKDENFQILRGVLGVKDEPNKFEYTKIKEAFEGNFDRKKKLFNRDGAYAHGTAQSIITMADEEYAMLSENNIFVIAKYFEVPQFVVDSADDISSLEDGLVAYHLENVYKPFYNIKEDAAEEVRVFIDSAIKAKTIPEAANVVVDFVKSLENGDALVEKYDQDLWDFSRDMVKIEKGDCKSISEMCVALVDKIQSGFDQPEVYEKEMRNAFENLRSVFAEDFQGLDAKAKVKYMVGLLKEYGLTRSNVKHPSEGLIKIIKEHNGKVITIIPFSKEESPLKKLINREAAGQVSKIGKSVKPPRG